MAGTGRHGVLLVAGALLLAACAQPAGSGPAEPSGLDIRGSWELVELSRNGSPHPLPAGSRATLDIGDGEVGGRSFCNSFSGEHRLDGDALSIGMLGGTEMGCAPDIMAAERAYLDALRVVGTAAVEDGELLLRDADTEVRFRRLPPVPVRDLVGTRWVLETLVDGEVASSVAGEPAVLVLSPDGTIEASTGCRSRTGTWTTSGDQVVLPESAMDGECPADLVGQDSHVTAALGDGFRAEVAGDRLTVTGRDGHGLVYRADR